MPERADVRLRIWWPLIILPIALLSQILAPHAVWLALVVTLTGLYSVGYFWVRYQTPYVGANRNRTGSILVAGDTLREDFELVNTGNLPVLWAEFIDESDLPNHSPGRVVACGANAVFRWREQVVCERRGIFRLGPHRLRLADPFGLFQVEISSGREDVLLIYPRVAHIPEYELPHGNSGESHRRQRPLQGALPSATIAEYRPGDSLRQIHWRSTARRARLMVKELETEPSGDVWIVLDLNQAVQSGAGQTGTLEYAVVIAASLAAQLLAQGGRSVGLLAVSGHSAPGAQEEDFAADEEDEEEAQKGGTDEADSSTILVPPQPSQAQMWRILTALASVEASDASLARVLHTSRELLGNRRTVIVITAETDIDTGVPLEYRQRVRRDEHDGASVRTKEERTVRGSWLSELAHLQANGLDVAALLIAGADDDAQAAQSDEGLRTVLAKASITSQVLHAGEPLSPALTFRRTRREVRSTPTGGAITVEVEEEVG